MSISKLPGSRIIERVSIACAGVVGLIVSGIVCAEDDAADIAFDDGSILVICGKPVTGDELSSDDFFAGFGEWITLLQQQANDGLIARAHYLPDLKDGVFIVFDGPDRAAARRQAESTISELTRVYSDIESTPDVEICRIHEIGPIAAFPR